MRVIAEGVETEQQRDTLLQLGCRGFQGYLTGRPMEAAEITRRLEAQISSAFDALLQPRIPDAAS
jgi:EAL domain-containing protein (putative c-di-GMP-specific phosphodiesterase class I)